MFLDKLLSTNITLVWLLFSMYLQVRGKLSSLCKLLSTNITLEWLLFIVFFQFYSDFQILKTGIYRTIRLSACSRGRLSTGKLNFLICEYSNNQKRLGHSSVIFVDSSLHREDNLPRTCKCVLKRSHTRVMFVEIVGLFFWKSLQGDDQIETL